MFSVVIPLYNKEKCIAYTLESVLKQTDQNFEIIIVDDGSTDKSVDIVKSFHDKRIHLYCQKNAGVSAARNRGIEKSKYELIAFLDADDEWLPNHLQELGSLTDKFSDHQVFATNYMMIENGNEKKFPIDTGTLCLAQSKGTLSHYFDVAVKTSPPLWTSAICVKKRTILDVGAFPVGIHLGEDLIVWARLASNFQIAYSKDISAIYHLDKNESSVSRQKEPDSNDYVGVELKKLLLTVNEINKKGLKRYIAKWHKMRLNEYLIRNNRKMCLKEYINVFKYNKTDLRSFIMFLLALLPETTRVYILKKIRKM